MGKKRKRALVRRRPSWELQILGLQPLVNVQSPSVVLC